MASAIALMTPFAEWLAREMAARGYQPDNRSQWATYLGIPYPTLSAWFNRGGRPSTEACEKIAARLSLPMATVLRMAGHPAPRERGTVPPASVPPWLADLIAGLDDAEQRMLGVTARELLRLREDRGPYEGQPRVDTPPPPAAPEEQPDQERP